MDGQDKKMDGFERGWTRVLKVVLIAMPVDTEKTKQGVVGMIEISFPIQYIHR